MTMVDATKKLGLVERFFMRFREQLRDAGFFASFPNWRFFCCRPHVTFYFGGFRDCNGDITCTLTDPECFVLFDAREDGFVVNVSAYNSADDGPEKTFRRNFQYERTPQEVVDEFVQQVIDLHNELKKELRETHVNK